MDIHETFQDEEFIKSVFRGEKQASPEIADPKLIRRIKTRIGHRRKVFLVNNRNRALAFFDWWSFRGRIAAYLICIVLSITGIILIPGFIPFSTFLGSIIGIGIYKFIKRSLNFALKAEAGWLWICWNNDCTVFLEGILSIVSNSRGKILDRPLPSLHAPRCPFCKQQSVVFLKQGFVPKSILSLYRKEEDLHFVNSKYPYIRSSD